MFDQSPRKGGHIPDAVLRIDIAISILRQDGWGQNSWGRRCGQHWACKGQALLEAYGQGVGVDRIKYRALKHLPVTPVILAAVFCCTGKRFRSIPKFNDHATTSQQSVIDVLLMARRWIIEGHSGSDAWNMSKWSRWRLDKRIRALQAPTTTTTMAVAA